jgi:acetoin utilization protein AcuB
MQVKAVMKTPVSTVEVGAPLPHARGLMARERTRHLPVVEGGRLVGVVSDCDLRRAEPSSVPALARRPWTTCGWATSSRAGR